MKGLPDTNFDQYRDTPIKLKPYDSNSQIIAKKYIKKITNNIDDKTLIVNLRGSIAFQISGKGDIDIAIYASEDMFLSVCNQLTKLFGQHTASGHDFEVFQLRDGTYDVEISLMKGLAANIDKKLNNFLLSHKDYVLKYESLKQKYCYSKREYLIQRDKFFRKILKEIPE